MIPSVGRTVHSVSAGSKDGTYPSVCRAATVVEVTEDPAKVRLMVMNPTGIHFQDARYGHNKEPMTWHWPERVEE